MFRKLESLKQDLGDGVSAFAQRSVQAAQELFLNPYTITELSSREYENYLEKSQIIQTYETVYLFKTDKWMDAIMESPRNSIDGKRLIFRIFRLPLQKESDAIESFERISVVLHELDISLLYSTNILQIVVNSSRKEPNWSSAHVAVDVNLKNVFSVNSLPTRHLERTNCDSLGRSPLALAFIQNKKEIIEHLIHIGAPTSTQDNKGNSIYHYCLEMGDDGVTLLQYLISHHREPDPAVNLANDDGETPLHIATRLNKEKFFHLLLDGARANAAIDSPGGRVIHLLLKYITEQKKRSELIEKVLTLAISEHKACDEKYQGTPMHWARSKQDVSQLLNFGASFEEMSFTEDRPLHIMIKKKRSDAAYALILHGAEINCFGQHGNTPLHCACEAGDTTLVKALILFGADFNHKNASGKTAGLVAIENRSLHGSDDLLLLMKDVGSMVISDSPLPNSMLKSPKFSQLLKKEEEEDGIASLKSSPKKEPVNINRNNNDARTKIEKNSRFERSKSATQPNRLLSLKMPRSKSENNTEDIEKRSRKKLRVLCLDGGGIRGLVLCQILLAIEQKSGKRIDQLFDYVSGTSTGGMLALGILKGLTTGDIQRFYLKLKDECFQGKRPYSEVPLEENLRLFFGESKLLDFSHPRVIVTSVVADRQPADLYLFRSYTPTGDVEQPATETTCGKPLPPIDDTNEYIWKAARCTGAAPSYFPSMERFLDGGLASNNPTMDTIVEIHREINATKKHYPEKVDALDEKIDVVVSVGTGNQPIIKSRAADAIWPSSVLDAYKSISATVELARMFVETVCEADRWIVQRSRTWCEMAGIKYYRLNPQLLSEVQLDEKSDELLFEMMWETKKYLHQNSDLIHEVVERLE